VPGDAEQIRARRGHRLPGTKPPCELKKRLLNKIVRLSRAPMSPGKVSAQVIAAFAEDSFKVHCLWLSLIH
jgi:hypothetical protein